MDAFAEGAQAFPDIELSGDDFAAWLAARSLPPDAPNGADLYLACACLAQRPEALRVFEASYLSQVRRYVARLQLGPDLLDELVQLLREKLLVGPPPRLGEYNGRGKLAAWLRVVSVRAAIDLMRERAIDPVVLESTPEPQAEVSSPELRALRNRYRPHFEAAFIAALDALSDEQRRLLRLHFVDGLNMEEIGRRFNVNRSTIFRRLNSCTRAVLTRLREQLGSELGVNSAELDSLTGLLRSDLEISLGQHLKTRP
jgi:RNA polymerase sigma-70 factor (ECF subfamily)